MSMTQSATQPAPAVFSDLDSCHTTVSSVKGPSAAVDMEQAQTVDFDFKGKVFALLVAKAMRLEKVQFVV